MTHFTPGSFALCDRGSKNVNKFSVSANLAYYRRTATKKDLPCWQVFVSWQKRAQSTNTLWRRKIQIWCQIKWHVRKCLFFYFQPWNNFKTPSWFSLTCLLPVSDIERIHNVTVQKTILNHIYSSCQSYLSGIKRKWSLSCSQETRKVTICQHHLMSFILLVSSGRSQTHVSRGQSVTQTAAPNTAQTSGQRLPVSTRQPNHSTDYPDLAVLKMGWVDSKIVFTMTGN